MEVHGPGLQTKADQDAMADNRRLMKGKQGHLGRRVTVENDYRYAFRIANKLAEQAENTGAPVVHVRDGKPLTAHGAKLLGVRWPVNR